MLRSTTQVTKTIVFSYKRFFASNITHTISKLNPQTNSHKANKFLIFCNSQITSNGRQGKIQEAESIFNRMPNKNIVSCTAMLTAYADNGQIDKARHVFDEMRERNIVSYNAMISAYARDSSRIGDAVEFFENMPNRNVVSYSSMITGLVRAGMVDKAEKLFFEMPVEWRDPVCSNCLISGYLKVGRFDEAVHVFDSMVEKNVVSWSCMVDGYCKEGRIVEAREMFDKMLERNVVCWTVMINGYMKCECFKDGFEMFSNLRREGSVEVNATTLTVMFEACGNFDRFKEGIQIHMLGLCLGLELDVFLGNSMITMYGRFGYVSEASKVFDAMSIKDLVSWNSLIAGYVQNGAVEEAYKNFQRMPQKDVVSWTTMITGFFSIGRIEKCIQLFQNAPVKDDIVWTAVISGFLENEEYEEAIRWFIDMLRQSVRLNPLTIICFISASAGLASLREGLQIHACALKFNNENDLSIQNSIISMYAKCGNVADAYRVFSKIHEPNIVSFNSMITGFAQNGLTNEALKLFKDAKDQGQTPNKITFLAILSACSHVGLVEEGWDYFKSMSSLYKIEPGVDHYACMVDLLGRAGKLHEAITLIKSMPFEPHAGVWGALLGASKTHLDLDLAKLAAQHISKLEPHNVTPYVVLSNMYSHIGKNNDEELVRRTMKWKSFKKIPGSSWIL